ncbi:MAG: hypothetical protein A2070_01290 [Bdellovibrionales bacterium GWC1_52_8]|nr:MAG: hypothetical protein A2Z97_07635 [Bdellovibrionales bacterium GWB1_52_6]OFZ04750.1 MAG: hypothetical protein A2X97_13575 [Bdellovibrionales bacterium GWA1_52_35]OFZ38174.1 MAG: hypothetical protein A2070_01290 [Bdellovibrionales bacterium GWC1_52_8]
MKLTVNSGPAAHYYSAWYYSAIHLLIAIPEFQTKEALHRRLRISLKKVSEVLAFLLECGLASEDRGRYTPGITSIHLGNDSPTIAKHHTNWRMHAIQALEHETPEELHYSSAVSIAREYMPRIRKVLTQAI